MDINSQQNVFWLQFPVDEDIVVCELRVLLISKTCSRKSQKGKGFVKHQHNFAEIFSSTGSTCGNRAAPKLLKPERQMYVCNQPD